MRGTNKWGRESYARVKAAQYHRGSMENAGVGLVLTVEELDSTQT